MLVRRHLRGIYEAAMVYLESRWSRQWTPGQVAAVKQHWVFTTPELATIASNHRFMTNIRLAGFPPHPMLVSETEAAAAWLLLDYARKTRGIPQDLSEEDEVLVCDGGGLTVNVACCRMQNLHHLASGVTLAPLRKAGAACGSHVLNRKCFDQVREKCERNRLATPVRGGFKGLCERAGLTVAQAEAQLAPYIETFKSGAPSQDAFMMFRGRDRATGLAFDELFQIDRQLLNEWLHEISREIMKLVVAVTKGLANMVLLTGGLFRNVWLIRELKAELEHQFVDIIVNYYGEERAGDGETSVARGGLLRSQPGQPSLSLPFSLAVLRHEPYSRRVHPSVTIGSEATYKDDGVVYVKKCWCNLIPYGDIAKTDTKQKTWKGEFVTYEIKAEDPFLREMVYTADHPIKDHQQVVAEYREDNEYLFFDGIEEWSCIERKIDRAKLESYPRKETDKGQMHCVTAKLFATIKHGHIKLGFEFTSPQFNLTKGINERRPPKTSNRLRLRKEVLHDSAFPSEVFRNRIPTRGDPMPSYTPWSESFTAHNGEAITLAQRASHAESAHETGPTVGRRYRQPYAESVSSFGAEDRSATSSRTTPTSSGSRAHLKRKSSEAWQNERAQREENLRHTFYRAGS